MSGQGRPNRESSLGEEVAQRPEGSPSGGPGRPNREPSPGEAVAQRPEGSPSGAPSRRPIGLIGLGIMGGMMAETLLQHGHSVVGYDITPATRQRLASVGGAVLPTATAVAEAADVVIVSLSTTAALDATVEALATSQRPATAAKLIVLETSTLPLADKERAQKRLAKLGITLLDCPISGTAARMKERAWTVYCSGPKTAVQRVRPILRAFTDNTPHVGVFGNGTRMKFAANHLVAILNVATAESINLARKLGLDPQQMLDLFGPSQVLGTGVMRLRAPFMIRREYSPPTMKVEVWQKDMQVIGDMAKSVDCPTPLFSACVPIYNAAMAQGRAAQDTASVSEVLAGMAGIPPAPAQAKTKPKAEPRQRAS
ncbi:MAG: NAD(P)-dependent oxidoreductase [Pigmentiphaga sp.]